MACEVADCERRVGDEVFELVGGVLVKIAAILMFYGALYGR